MKNTLPNGSHILIELYGCDTKQINEMRLLKKDVRDLIKGCGIHIIGSKFKKFYPRGITGMFLLSASHVSIHTWPEFRYLTIDVFTCSGEAISNHLKEEILKLITHERSVVREINRGFSYESKKLPIFSNAKTMNVVVVECLYKSKNEYQNIEILETAEFGKCLIIDDVMQLSEKDHDIYDSKLINEIKLKDKKILILGGGDLFVAKNIINTHPQVDEITIIDLDKDVYNSCLKYFHNDVVENEIRVELIDAIRYLKENLDKIRIYDYIIIDLTDSPVGGKDSEFECFYQELILILSTHARENTVVAIQAGTPRVKNGKSGLSIIKRLIKKNNHRVISIDKIFIPSFGEKAAFIKYKI